MPVPLNFRLAVIMNDLTIGTWQPFFYFCLKRQIIHNMKKETSNSLQLINKGHVTAKEAKRAASFILNQMSKGSNFDCEHHGSELETVFVFIANGLCCTMHVQPLEKEGGKG